jgi:hypothetical protein
VMKLWGMRWAGHVAHMAKNGNTYGIVVGKPEGMTPLGRLRLSMKDNINVDRNKGMGGMGGTHVAHCRDRSGCCEHGNERLSYVNWGNVWLAEGPLASQDGVLLCGVSFFLWWRASQQKLRTHRSLKAYCATLWWRWGERWLVFSFFQVLEHRWNEIDRGKPKY